jgi:hypothetical protein
MSDSGVKVKITKLPPLLSILTESELALLEQYGTRMVEHARAQWTGWKYGKNYPEWQRGESNAAWQYSLLEQTTGGRERGISLTNDAQVQQPAQPRKDGKPRSTRSVGKYYARHVTRSGSSEPEYLEVERQINDQIMPSLLADLKKEILANAGLNRETVELEDPRPGAVAAELDIFSGKLA